MSAVLRTDSILWPPNTERPASLSTLGCRLVASCRVNVHTGWVQQVGKTLASKPFPTPLATGVLVCAGLGTCVFRLIACFVACEETKHASPRLLWDPLVGLHGTHDLPNNSFVWRHSEL